MKNLIMALGAAVVLLLCTQSRAASGGHSTTYQDGIFDLVLGGVLLIGGGGTLYYTNEMDEEDDGGSSGIQVNSGPFYLLGLGMLIGGGVLTYAGVAKLQEARSGEQSALLWGDFENGVKVGIPLPCLDQHFTRVDFQAIHLTW